MSEHMPNDKPEEIYYETVKENLSFSSESEVREINGLPALAELVFKLQPAYIHVSDVHITAVPQEITQALLRSIHASPLYISGKVGFFVEALDSTANPHKGDLHGAVLNWDSEGKTNYHGVIQTAVDLNIPTYGIDLNEQGIDARSERRMFHWQQQIEKRKERIKILLLGSGHLFNNKKETADIMHRLKGDQWVIEREKAYSPPGYKECIPLNIGDVTLTKEMYKVLQYPEGTGA